MKKQENLTDIDLIEKAKRNPEIFGILMERYSGPLFHYIRRLTQSPKEDVEDLLQEIFIKIYQKLNEYDAHLKFSSWAYRIAHNHTIDYFRRNSARVREDQLESDEWEKMIVSSIHPGKNIADKDCVEKIAKCMRELPLKYQEVLILRFMEEKSYEEIMDILKKTKGTVATLVARGKEKLKLKMKEKGINCF